MNKKSGFRNILVNCMNRIFFQKKKLKSSGRSRCRVPGFGHPPPLFFGRPMHLNEDMLLEPPLSWVRDSLFKTAGYAPVIPSPFFIVKRSLPYCYGKIRDLFFKIGTYKSTQLEVKVTRDLANNKKTQLYL